MLEDIYPEVVVMCNQFNARASIRLNKRSFKDVAWKTMINLSNTMRNQEFKFVKNCYDRACGQGHNDKDKTWIIDLDDYPGYQFLNEFDYIEYLKNLQPIGNKVKAVIPTLNGSHLITSPFNTEEFKRDYPNFDIHKNNPTILYFKTK